MREAGVNVVTVGVFCWAHLEPRPGERDFGWLDRVLDLLHAGGVHVFLATHTIAPNPPNIIEKGMAALGTVPKFLLPKPMAYPRPSPTPMQPRMMTTLSIFHFAPGPVAMANPVPKSNATNQSAAMDTPYLPTV